MNWNLDAEPKTLLTVANPKTAKGEKHGFLTAIMHLAPEKASGTINVCPHASAGCAAACLNTAGRGGIGLDKEGLNVIQVARIQRTRLFKRDRGAFLERLADEIEAHQGRAWRHGLEPAVRLNGTSDLPFEKFPFGEGSILEAFPDVRFYDYTKWPIHLRDPGPDYHLTFSLSEENEQVAARALEAGTNVAMVFAVKKGRPFPASYELGGIEAPVIDGDLSDLRFTDAPGSIVGLRAKGRAIGSTDGFVRLPESEKS